MGRGAPSPSPGCGLPETNRSTRDTMNTKLPLLVLMSALALAGTVEAQTAVGVRVGMGHTSLTGSQQPDALTGLAVGGYFGLGLGDRVAVQLEVGYNERGGGGVMVGENQLDPDGGTASDIRLRYIEVPVLLRAGYAGARFLPSLFIGPYVGFLTSCELTPAGGNGGACDDQTRDAWFNPRSTDWGLVAGGGLDFALGESTIFLDARYALGLFAIQRGSGGMDLSNTGFTLSAGFAVPLSR